MVASHSVRRTAWNMTRCKVLCRVVCVLWACGVASGCATTLPSFAGASITPPGRTEVAGGAVAVSSTATPAPVVAVRHGTGAQWDVGLVVAPWLARVDARRSFTLWQTTTTQLRLVTSASPYGGASEVQDRQAPSTLSLWRAGLEVPVVLALQAGGVYELWAGGRGGVEYVDGTIESPTAAPASSTSDVHGWGPWVAGVVGAAVGFERLHVLVELSSRYTAWEPSANTSFAPQSRRLEWVPAMALRLRL